jgi:ribonucleoside-diphosphate reductase alpha chain
MYNCLTQDAEFVTSAGVMSFRDFEDGDETIVLTHTGAWKKATVRRYGVRDVNRISFSRGGRSVLHEVLATPDHRWFLSNGDVTTSLAEGDSLLHSGSRFHFDFGDAPPDERIYWCYGYVYGDGTVNGDYSHVRLCRKDQAFASRFEGCGFKTSQPDSLEGDFYAFTGTYKKTLPDLNREPLRKIRAFIAGLMDADGTKIRGTDRWLAIQQTGEESISWLLKALPLVGLYITRIDDFSDQATNYGPRSATTKRIVVTDNSTTHSNAAWKVRKIEPAGEEETWCLEVEDDQSFVLPQGVVTGNCAFQVIDSIESFAECLFVLMCGTGYGFSVERRHVEKLPVVPSFTSQGVGEHVVADSKEGWADSVKALMTAIYSGKDLAMNYTELRPQGARLKTMGGRSSGPAPLLLLHNFIRETFAEAQGRKLTPLECHDILNQIAEIVVVGGVRRSSQISLSDLDDTEMASAKSWPFPPRRAMANNSAVYLEKPSSARFMTEMGLLANSGTGERGIFNLHAARLSAPERRKSHLILGTNPCGEISLRSRQFCNLSEVVVRAGDDVDDLLDKVETAVWLGAIQSTFTHFPYLSRQWARNCNEERLLGASLTGQLDNFNLIGDPTVLTALNKKALKVAKHASQKLGIPFSAAVTCGKPSGTVSQLVNCASGCHARYSDYYLRRYRISSTDPLYRMLRDQGLRFSPEVGQRLYDWEGARDSNNPSKCSIFEPGKKWSEDKVRTWVCEFPVKSPDGAITRNQLSAIDQLQHYLTVQKNWCEHNQSCTVYVKDDEWFEVGDFVYKHWDSMNGVSFLPYDGGHYDLAPYEEISREQYEMDKETFPKIDYSKLSEYEMEDSSDGNKTWACSGDKCELS